MADEDDWSGDAEEFDSDESDEDDESDEEGPFEDDEDGSEEEEDDSDEDGSEEEEDNDEDNDEDSESEGDDESYEEDIDIPKMLMIGLKRAHFSALKIGRNKIERQLEWFQSAYGCPPSVAVAIWEDLDTLIDPDEVDFPISIDDFLMTLEWLHSYQPERRREGHTGLSPKTIRKRCWYYAGKLQALKEQKIVWPNDIPPDSIWLMTVDGTHFMVNEPKHPEFSQDKDYFSHKKHRSGWCYELGLCLYKNNLIWMKGPYKAGQNDKNNFTRPGGLKEKLAQLGLKAIGDKFYNGYPNEVSTFNRYDSAEVKKFKSRALLRQEKFNGYLKQFDILDHRFRHHGPEKFATCFEAVAVITQYRIELECPLEPL